MNNGVNCTPPRRSRRRPWRRPPRSWCRRWRLRNGVDLAPVVALQLHFDKSRFGIVGGHQIVRDRLGIVGRQLGQEARRIGRDCRVPGAEGLVILHQVRHGGFGAVDGVGVAVQFRRAGQGNGVSRRLQLHIQGKEAAAVDDQRGEAHEHRQRDRHIDQRRAVFVVREMPAEAAESLQHPGGFILSPSSSPSRGVHSPLPPVSTSLVRSSRGGITMPVR